MILCCGEALIDLVSTDGVTYTATPGGSAINTAVAGAKLGGRFALMARFSGDAFGARLREFARHAGVDLSHAVAAPEQTTLAIATADGMGDATYNFYLRETADWQWDMSELPASLDRDVNCLHVGSMALEVNPGRAVIEALVGRESERKNVTIFYDPNVRLAHGATGVRNTERLVRMADIVKVSHDDLERLDSARLPETIAAEWSTVGPQFVYLTLGEQGALAFRRGTSDPIKVDAPHVDVKDSIGAGDTFCAAVQLMLDRLNCLGTDSASRLSAMGDDEFYRVLTFAVHAASLTCERLGSNAPTADEVYARFPHLARTEP